jgi:hypothetical protein
MIDLTKLMSEEDLELIERRVSTLDPEADKLGMRAFTDDFKRVLADVRRLRQVVFWEGAT